MKATNCTKENLVEAMEEVNKKYQNNIEFKRLDKQGRGFVFTLTVKDSKKPGHRLGSRINKDGKHNRVKAACWHVHGDFFDSLIGIEPDTVIKTGDKTIDVDGGNWQDWNIGSRYQPMYYSEACDCE